MAADIVYGVMCSRRSHSNWSVGVMGAFPQAPSAAKSGFSPSVRAADALHVGASGRASLRIRSAKSITMAEAKKSVKDLPAGFLKGKKVSHIPTHPHHCTRTWRRV